MLLECIVLYVDSWQSEGSVGHRGRQGVTTEEPTRGHVTGVYCIVCWQLTVWGPSGTPWKARCHCVRTNWRTCYWSVLYCMLTVDSLRAQWDTVEGKVSLRKNQLEDMLLECIVLYVDSWQSEGAVGHRGRQGVSTEEPTRGHVTGVYCIVCWQLTVWGPSGTPWKARCHYGRTNWRTCYWSVLYCMLTVDSLRAQWDTVEGKVSIRKNQLEDMLLECIVLYVDSWQSEGSVGHSGRQGVTTEEPTGGHVTGVYCIVCWQLTVWGLSGTQWKARCLYGRTNWRTCYWSVLYCMLTVDSLRAQWDTVEGKVSLRKNQLEDMLLECIVLYVDSWQSEDPVGHRGRQGVTTEEPTGGHVTGVYCIVCWQLTVWGLSGTPWKAR